MHTFSLAIIRPVPAIPARDTNGAEERELQGGKYPALPIFDRRVVGRVVLPCVEDVDSGLPVGGQLERTIETAAPAALQDP